LAIENVDKTEERMKK